MEILALPGYADTPRYWSRLFADLGPVREFEWPGLWGSSFPPASPLDALLSAVAPHAPGSLVLAHSASCRLALELADLAGLVLLAPALGPLSFLTPEIIEEWRRTGYRISKRPDPDTGAPRELLVPYSYALAWSSRPAPPTHRYPTLAILLSEDTEQNALAKTALGPAAIVEIPGPHRWWQDPSSALAVVAAVTEWVNETLPSASA